jgi:RNA polymerase sigma factor (sigma-70 family)
MAYGLARRFWLRWRGDLGDWRQEAAVGLIACSYRFDLGRGLRFTTLAHIAIIHRLCLIAGRRVRAAQRQERTISLAAEGVPDPAAPAESSIEPDELGLVHSALAALCPRDRLVIERVVMEERSHAEAGRELGLSRERVRQLLLRALRRLEDNLGVPGIFARWHASRRPRRQARAVVPC